ncbi:MAG: DJ-1/PfpI family protein [Lachnospiraceae bacterium]|nr:DJ-1/PfpI family protein [Lachnospiraceae bacterium]
MSKKMAVFLAEGFEEGEAIVPIDIARRAGIEVTMVSVSDKISVTGSHGIQVRADALLSDTDLGPFEMLMLPGGMPGTRNLEDSDSVREAVLKANGDGKYIAAICAAPRLLGKLGILNGKKATVYPGNEEYLKNADYDDKAKAVTDKNVITARGMGCAVEFGGEIVAALVDADTAEKILASIQAE